MPNIEPGSGWRRGWLGLGLVAFACTSSASDLPSLWQCKVVRGMPAGYQDARFQVWRVKGWLMFNLAGVASSTPCWRFDSGKPGESDAFSGKMLDTNGDGQVDSVDTPSEGVVFIGEIPALDGEDGESVNDSSDGTTSQVEQAGGSRRIMWRQIQ